MALLLIAAHGYQRLTRNQEERRQARTGSTRPHGDLTSIFFFPAAVLLPLWLATTLIITVRWARYVIARQPPFRFIKTTASIIAAAATAHRLAAWMLRHQPANETWQAEAHMLIIVIAGIGYVTQQIVVVAFLKRLAAPPADRLTRVHLFGSNEHLTDLATAIALATLLTAADASMPATLTMTFLAIKIHELVTDRETGRHDGGTGLATKARWTELATQSLYDAPAQNRTPGLLIVDLDHFEQVNDTYHHLVGDMLLREVADQLPGSVRPDDIVGRFGGEEFVVLLHDSDNARAIAERIQQIDLVFTRSAGGEPVVLSNRTASIGIAVADTPDATLDSLLASADAALYQAKAAGRNRVVGPWVKARHTSRDR
ncbi:GGDEF domain-containing protein [Umezawaea sp. Da 62-37]|uniref:GGDEF domain-containing protein n=1 Tax=Umezawaea sp. Da 62-37 TaxID=3075927 RepID=UPI0028F72B94|nr:GGDEF domain-containing protein [Umezawaea sp. Da 62-37]WNV84746.1 GGDEF domain-containing protein [Umezawaea sp. Da 62-37]